MSLEDKLRYEVRRILLGPTDLPQACDLALHSPQSEISVWLHGMGEPRDVTTRHSAACAAPFMFCIGFENKEDLERHRGRRLSLLFCERGGRGQLLGEISLELSSILPTAGPQLCLFKAINCTNFCLPRPRLWAHYLHHAYDRWKKRKVDDVGVSPLDDRCNAVTFICPRPVVLVSLLDGDRGNIFPMNLMGTVGRDYLVFALNSKRQAAPLVGQLGQLAISSIPFNQAPTVRQLGKNHRQQSIDWEKLPFRTQRSKVLHIPVPEFALRVRELKVQYARPLGSHTFFVTRIVGEEVHADGPEFCMIHGLYEARRRRNGLSAH
jgi:flavin reductase (DIM6/NTAB) family NADH-FMN oxidoreductase RutF